MEERISLYYQAEGSDKEYHVQLAAAEGGFLVNLQYGRRGGTLAVGTKTKAPVPYQSAKKIYDKLVQEKTSKGYTTGESGVAFEGTENAGRKTGFVPQLLNPITEAEALRLIRDDGWVAQEKKDGEHRAVKLDSGGVMSGINRKGLSVPLPEPVAKELLGHCAWLGAAIVDGEIIGDKLHVFDLYCFDSRVFEDNSLMNGDPYETRMSYAQTLFSSGVNVVPIKMARTTEEKKALWDRVRAEKGEGVVFKRRDSLFTPGRPNSGGDWVKFKFTESASCQVIGTNEGKRSVKIGLLDSGKVVPVGNVTIPANHVVPDVGDVVEVEYLYAYPGGSLFQPVYRGRRTDIDLKDCTLAQLKYKPENLDEDDVAA
jgi:bifunctional non-homologous end joining protein LigD